MFKKSGFTMLESIIFILITSLLLIIALPGIFGFSRWNALEENGRKIEAVFIKARYLAASFNMRHRVYFNPSANCFYIHCDKNNNRTFDRGEKIIGPYFLTDGVKFSCDHIIGPPSNPHKQPSSPVTFNRHIASCSPTGVWSNPGTVYLKDKNGDYLAITLNIKGVIRMYWWDRDEKRWKN